MESACVSMASDPKAQSRTVPTISPEVSVIFAVTMLSVPEGTELSEESTCLPWIQVSSKIVEPEAFCTCTAISEEVFDAISA